MNRNIFENEMRKKHFFYLKKRQTFVVAVAVLAVELVVADTDVGATRPIAELHLAYATPEALYVVE